METELLARDGQVQGVLSIELRRGRIELVGSRLQWWGVAGACRAARRTLINV